MCKGAKGWNRIRAQNQATSPYHGKIAKDLWRKRYRKKKKISIPFFNQALILLPWKNNYWNVLPKQGTISFFFFLVFFIKKSNSLSYLQVTFGKVWSHRTKTRFNRRKAAKIICSEETLFQKCLWIKVEHFKRRDFRRRKKGP